MGVAEVDESSTSDHSRAVHAFKFVLIEHLRDVLKPFWQQGNLSKDAYKIIIKKSMDKIIGSIEASKFPRTKTDHQRYLSASKSKIFDLIQAYVKKYQKVGQSAACFSVQNFIAHWKRPVSWRLNYHLFFKQILEEYDGNGDKGFVLTKMSPGFDNWRLERQCSSTHGESVQPYRSATEPEIEPEEKFGRTPTLFVEGEREEELPKENEKGNMGVAEADESSTSDHIRAVHSFKFVLFEHIRDVLNPFLQQGNLSKDAYKIIIKKIHG